MQESLAGLLDGLEGLRVVLVPINLWYLTIGVAAGIVIALWSDGSRERMSHVLTDHKLMNLTPVASWPQALALPRHSTYRTIESGPSGSSVIASARQLL